MFAARTYAVKANIALSDAVNSVVKLREHADFTNAFDNSYDSPNPNPSGINVYSVLTEDSRWMSWYTNDLEGTVLGFTANNGESYTMTFTNVSGTLYLLDAVTGTRTLLTENGTYPFTVATNLVGTTINDRFTITKIDAPSAPSICHQYGKLAITGHNGETVSIKEMDGTATSIEDRTLTEDYVEIDLAALNGKYRVTVGTETFVINTNPTVVPENN